ncbi:MAG: leucine--tRNA ligase, partial [Oscillospiraceae bacterium]|nr:leucine--tRNA ligase [Oscillospiraceae bacterium]
MKYDFTAIEKKWQAKWEETKPYAAVTGDPRPKFYGLIEFPYPSAQGLHVGHPRPFTAMDVITRKKRMQGYNVLFPIGYDAFGLPTENYAIKNHIHPAIVTRDNIANFTRQLKMLGYGFDWDRCVNTSSPEYYKWTQWIFLQFFKRGLAYKATMSVNWCTSCKVVLANEEVVEGVCERCGAPVVRKEKSQWMLGITKYADRLIDDLDDLDFIDRVKAQQKNWIGRSTGCELTFKTNMDCEVTVYTTRADTLFGTSYMVISPEHPLLNEWSDRIGNWAEVEAYREAASRKSDFERGELNKDKTGVRLQGVEILNPVTGKMLPMFVSDYVLMGYGTGVVMGVPGHDQRDWDFATKFGLPIIEVVAGGDVSKCAFVAKDDSAVMVNSGFLNGMTVRDAIPAMKEYAVAQGFGKLKTNFKLRDWVFSRQRYWGEPIPLVYCEKCGWQAIPESELPLELPNVESYEPTDDGESPLAKMTDWVNTTCPCCGGPAKRETDTMPNWAGSSWYFLRYMDPDNKTEAVSKEAEEYWGPVDWYNGGMEHTTLHLLYSRFWHKFLYDIGVVHTKEPYARRTSHGMILGHNPHYVGNVESEAEKQALIEKYGNQALRQSVKMSKSLGNVINPDDVVSEFGA